MSSLVAAALTLLAGTAASAQDKDKVDFECIGEHPSAVKQITDEGKRLCTAFEFEGKVYWGYGDWNENTGPIDICSLDPKTLQFTKEYTAETENISVYRRLSDNLYELSAPQGAATPTLTP